ncbi:MAG: hypothetical protein KDE68_03895 [Rhodocyclaceae bacterium]|nr:hypothetical protein [Rhodocyclaceae bacterium]
MKITTRNAARCGLLLGGMLIATTAAAVSNLTVSTPGSTATKLSLFNRANTQVASGVGGLTATAIDAGGYTLRVETPTGLVTTDIALDDDSTCTYNVDTSSGKAERIRCVPLMDQQQQQQEGWSLIGMGGYKRSPFSADVNTQFGNGSTDLDDSGWRFSLETRRYIRTTSSGRVFAWAGVDLFSGIDKRDLFLDVHPTAGNDTGAALKEEYGFRLGIGQSWKLGGGLTLDGMLGLHGTRVEGQLITDESGGGGVRETFAERKWLFGPTVGLGLSYPLSGMPNAFFHTRATFDYMPELSISGRSSNAFDYSTRIDGGWQPSLQFGIGSSF